MFDSTNLTKKALLKCPRAYKHELKQSKCSVTISVGQPTHDGEKLKATLIEVNNNFKECTIMVCDSLQRHTLKIDSNLSIEELHLKSNQLGNEWLGRNLDTIKQLDIKYNIIRWDEWLLSKDYKKARSQIDVLYSNDISFYSVIEKTALNFLDRYLNKSSALELREDILNNSREYLKEESAIMLMWAQANYHFEVYPSPRNLTLKYIHQHLIAASGLDMVKEISVKFKTIRSYKNNISADIYSSLEFQKLINALPSQVYILDQNNVYINCNLLQAKALGFNNIKDVIGKRNMDMPVFARHQQLAEIIDNNNSKIIANPVSEPVEQEEEIPYVNSEIGIFKSYKTPLMDKAYQIVGLLVISYDITKSKKELKLLQEKCEERDLALDNLLANLPGHIYWMDTKNRFLGCNDQQAYDFNLKSRYDVIGLSAKYSQTPENAAIIIKNNNKVMSKGITITDEENFKDMNGMERVYLSRKVPLKNKQGEIVGLLGTSLDITDSKEKEKLIFENETHKAAAIEQEKFKKIIGQMLHDIQSPLSSLSTIVEEQSSALPESTRITLRNAKNRIGDIATNLLTRYEQKDKLVEKPQSLLVSLALLQIMSEKRYEYSNTAITFKTELDASANFIFIQINPSDFKRMISNLLNNAVDAVKNKADDGIITIKLTQFDNDVVIFISDNGPGMPAHIQEKFKQGIAVTEGKENGHGIGLTQVRETVTANGGKVKFSVSNDGTKAILRFPVVVTPPWITSEIKLTVDNTIVIVDDDISIHGAWDEKLKQIREKFPELKVHHYTDGQDAAKYINSITPEEKQNVFLLTDYELLNQPLNGLDIINTTQITKTILVTSHSSCIQLQEQILAVGIKTLPKELVHAITITVDKKIPKHSRKVDMVWLEDQREFVDDMVRMFYSHIKVDIYYSYTEFLTEVDQYTLDTRFILDSSYAVEGGLASVPVDGFMLAEKLYTKGYTNLILFTGGIESWIEIPAYLTVILKNDLENRKILDKIKLQ